MKQIIQHEELGQIVYYESVWTGKKELSINGVYLDKTSKTSFRTKDGLDIYLKGNLFSGIKMSGNFGTYDISPPTKWYEYALALIPLIFILIWSNVPALFSIIPVVGGFIGGAIAGLFGVLSVIVMKKAKKIWLKLVIGLAFFALVFLVCFLIGFLIIAAFS